MLTEQQCKSIETVLWENVEPRKVAAYLCLHMGLTLSEVTALQWADVDVTYSTLTLRNAASSDMKLMPLNPQRRLHMPPHVVRYLRKCATYTRTGNAMSSPAKRNSQASIICRIS